MKKDLNNIVVEKAKTKEELISIIKAFNDLGFFNNSIFNGDDTDLLDWNYGVIGDELDGYTDARVKCSKAKIITLEQLKAMKEDKSEYPKLMYVGDTMHEIENDKLLKKARYVFYKDDYGYWAYIGDNKIESIEKTEVAYRYKYAQDIEEEKTDPKKEVIDITIPNLENVIVTINGKEVEYKLENNNIILEP